MMKQAVVLIHGIGEQKPMETLRSFTSAVLPPAEEGKDQYWSKPDPMSELFELRRLQAPGRNQTHFYEYYWAYHVEGTKLSHLATWFVDLMWRKRQDVPPALRTIWLTLWALSISLFVVAVSGGFAYVKGWYDEHQDLGVVNIVLILIIVLLQGFLIHYVGDAARYLSSNPKNIKLRKKIRAEGLELLRQLHKSRLYDRIIVVGHSLGSVIGYDLISRLWIDYNTNYEFHKHEKEIEESLNKGLSPQPVIRHGIYDAAQNLKVNTDKSLDEFREAQVKGYLEQRRLGNKWRITDFITLGSPLAHAMLLQASSQDEFKQRKQQRELPTCPPIEDQKGYAYANKSHIDLPGGKKFCPLFLHHAAPFAVTRWTNIYFPVFYGFFGDVVGGPLKEVYGLGIRDIPVKINSFKRFTISAHTSYWKQTEINNTKGFEHAIVALKKAIALDEGRKFK